MATLTIRDLPEDVRDKLRIRAAENRRSMEAEVRALLGQAVDDPSATQRTADWDDAVREARDAFAPFRNPKVSVVDELIADRRLEAWRETVESYEWLNRHGTEPLQRRAPRSR